MKYFLIIFFLIPFAAFSQESKEPFKKANAILIKTSLPAEEAFRMVGQTIIEAGYGIKNSDKDFFSINSEPKPFRYGQLELTMSVTGNDNAVVRITGKYQTGIINDLYTTVDFRGMKGSPAKEAWEEMQKVAEKIEGEKVYTTI